MLVIEALEVAGQTRLGSPIDDDRLSATLSRNGAEHAQRPAPFGKKRLLGGLAEQDGVAEVDPHEPFGELGVSLELLLGREDTGGDDDRIEASQRVASGIDGGREHLGTLEVARHEWNRPSPAPHMEVRGAALEIRRIPTQQADRVSPLCHQASKRSPHPFRRAQKGNSHVNPPTSAPTVRFENGAADPNGREWP